MTAAISEQDVMYWLSEVMDPEIPVLSLVDLGVIRSVDIDGDTVTVEMTPTFVGCPAMDYMKSEVVTALINKGIVNPVVVMSFRSPWSSDMISAKGRDALKKFGLAPPPDSRLFTDLEILERASCPRCNGSNTEMRTPFGPTLCRSIHFCCDCKEAFEQFKPI